MRIFTINSIFYFDEFYLKKKKRERPRLSFIINSEKDTDLKFF